MKGFRMLLVVATVVVVAVAAEAASAARQVAASPSTTADRTLASGVLTEINGFRAAHGLSTLKLSRQLSGAATRQSAAMGRYGFFAHDSYDGSVFWKRIQRTYVSNGYKLWSVGENLLWSTSVDAPGALDLWVASPHHLANLMAPQWREVGISALRVAAAPGVFGGRDVTIITTDFGVRR